MPIIIILLIIIVIILLKPQEIIRKIQIRRAQKLFYTPIPIVKFNIESYKDDERFKNAKDWQDERDGILVPADMWLDNKTYYKYKGHYMTPSNIWTSKFREQKNSPKNEDV